MKISLSWLRDYVEIDADVATLVDRLTIAGLEVASLRFFGLPVPANFRTKIEEKGPVWDRDKILTAQVLHIEKHPNADKLKIVSLDIGTGTPKQVVTGAPNIAVGDSGQKVIVALTGSVLFDGHATPKVLSELKPTMLRGVPSDSMVCSAFELGIHDDHDGIIILEKDAPVGVPLMDFMGDAVLEADVLPNMARCLSMIGVAREVAALTGRKTCLPVPKVQTVTEAVKGQVEVSIEDSSKSARYQARLIRNVQAGASPGWMQRRLQYSGIKSIGNVVDITNYVMMETGQPMHAFDYDILKGRAGGQVPKIQVRAAKAGEKLLTLDNVERELTPDNLVIADEKGPIALAGVMGGKETEVSAATRNVLLEAAHFDFVSIRKTGKQFAIFNDASTRYSRGIHPEIVELAASRACELLHQIACGEVLAGSVDCYPAPPSRQVVSLKQKDVKRLLGIDITPVEVVRILEALQFEVSPDGADGWQVKVPAFRLDIQAGAADLIEEIARIHGYNLLPGKALSGELPEPKIDSLRLREEEAKDILSLAGLHETINYSLTTRTREAAFVAGDAKYVELLNPISEERSVMRQSILASVLEVAANNLRHRDTIRLFEIGSVFVPTAGESFPREAKRLAIVLTGLRGKPAWDDALGQKPAKLDFFDLKGIVEELLKSLHARDVRYRPAKDIAFLHPGRSAFIHAGDVEVGTFGELHPTVAGKFGLAERSVLVADLDFERLVSLLPGKFSFKPVPRFPAALQDMAVVVDEALSNEQITREIRAAGGDLLKEVRLFDLYQGDSIAAGKKSLAYSLAYQADDRTLSEKEIEKAHKKIEDRLRHVLKAGIRGKDA